LAFPILNKVGVDFWPNSALYIQAGLFRRQLKLDPDSSAWRDLLAVLGDMALRFRCQTQSSPSSAAVLLSAESAELLNKPDTLRRSM
jgi:hypothetical protein